jgi:hypothetical protein
LEPHKLRPLSPEILWSLAEIFIFNFLQVNSPLEKIII